MKNPDRTILIDGNNVLHRAQAVYVDAPAKRGDPPMLSPDGLPIGLIQGTLGMLSDWLPSIRRPTRIVFFKDGTARRRKEVDPGYKLREARSFGSGPVRYSLADGHEVEGDLGVIDHVIKLLGADVCHGPDDEADDLIASFIRAAPPGAIHFIVSSDRDFYQLLGDNVIQYRPGIDGNRFFDPERAAEDMGVPPRNVRMFKALTGDATDTYKGIMRLRTKVAAKLAEHPDPAAMYAADLSCCSKLERERLLEGRARVETNFVLAGMHHDIDLSGLIDPATPDPETALRVLRRLGVSGVDPASFKTRHVGVSVSSEPALSYFRPDLFSDL